jgi:hypothetical protein
MNPDWCENVPLNHAHLVETLGSSLVFWLDHEGVEIDLSLLRYVHMDICIKTQHPRRNNFSNQSNIIVKVAHKILEILGCVVHSTPSYY